MADVANEEALFTPEAQKALFEMLPGLYRNNPLQVNAITAFAQNMKPLIDKMPSADRNKLIVAINANPKAATDAMLGLITDGKGTFDPVKAKGATDHFADFSATVLKKISPVEVVPAAATTAEAALSQNAQLAIKGAIDKIRAGNPNVPEAQIHQVSVAFTAGVQALPQNERNLLINTINANPEAAANSLYKAVTDRQGVFTPKTAEGMTADFHAFANKMYLGINAAPSLPVSSELTSKIESDMHAQLSAAFDKGLVNVGNASSPLTKEESAWFEAKIQDESFAKKMAADTIASFHIDKAAGTYDKAAFDKYIQNPERTLYESARRVDQAAQPNATQSFTAVATDPNQSPALVAFEKKLGETRPDLKKQYDEFAKGHAEFRGNMAQILADVPEMGDAAIQNPALLKVAMENSSLAAKKIRENKDEIRKPTNLALLPLASASDIRGKLGMPTPAGETPGLDDGMTRSGEMLRSVIQMIGGFLAKIFPGLAPYIDEFANMAGKVGSTAAVFMGIDKPGTQSTGDTQLAADAKAAVPGAKPADAKPADAKPADAKVDDPAAEQRRRVALGYG